MAMLGATCNACCGGGDACGCQGGTLPDKVTVSFSGLVSGRYRGPDLISLSISNCFACCATGKVVAPGGDAFGPITSASLTSQAPFPNRFAKRGRRAPTLTITGSGTGATFTPTYTTTTDSCGLTTWAVQSIAASGGTGYVYGEWLTIAEQIGDTAEQAAAAHIVTQIQPPTITASATGGTGATFGVTIAPNGTTPQTWAVSDVTVTNGGTGYPASGYITFSVATGDTEQQAASAMFACGRVQPSVSVFASGSGSGAVLSASLVSETGWDGLPYWYISGISVTSGGSGYSELDQVFATVTDGEGGGLYAEVSSVDQDGAITAVSIYWGGGYYKSTGVIQSVALYNGGSYYRDAGIPTAVVMSSNGIYYREDNSLPIIAPPVTVAVNAAGQYNGSGAVITASVDLNPASNRFGLIDSLTVVNGGQYYRLWDWKRSAFCVERFNEKSYTLPLGTTNPCRYVKTLCEGNYRGSKDVLSVTYRGPNTPPLVQINVPSPAATVEFEASGTPPPCSNFSFTATEPLGGTATVSPGGAAPELPCGGCCITPSGVFQCFGDAATNCGSICLEAPGGSCVLPPEQAYRLGCTPQQCQSIGGTWHDICPPLPDAPFVPKVVDCKSISSGGFFFEPLFCKYVDTFAKLLAEKSNCEALTGTYGPGTPIVRDLSDAFIPPDCQGMPP